MKLYGSWTFGGDFVLTDPDEDAPMVRVEFMNGLRDRMLDKEDRVALFEFMLAEVRVTPHAISVTGDE